jgi:hypothetical protein
MKTLLALLGFLLALPAQAFVLPHSGFLIPSPMDSATLLRTVEDYLQPLLTAEKALLSVAETEEDAIEMLSNGPERWRVILTMDGDEAAEDLNPAGLVKGTLIAWVQAPKGMEAKPGKGLHRQSTGGGASFMTRLHWVIKKIRRLEIIHEEVACQAFEYKGWNWLRFEETAAFRTARARFEILFAHDDPATDSEGTEPIVLPSAFRITGATPEFYTIALSGAAHGRVPRFEAGFEDPTGTATGYALTSAEATFYTVALDGQPHGRIPRFET